jgi:sec-independent protein translocase protein TatC
MSPTPDQNNAEPQTEGTLLSHLLELRSRLLKIAIAVLVLFVCLAPFSENLFRLVALPLMEKLPEGATMIATQVASPFLTPFKLTFLLALFLAIPVILYQIWAFVAPGLYQQEKRFVLPLLASSIMLFYMGVAFAYYLVFPLMFSFFTAVAPVGVTVMTDISSYLDFVLTLFFAFGIAFEVPVATVLLVRAGIVTPSDLTEKRPYVFLGCFVVGMLLTPPDVISQTLLALPVYCLYEIGIVMARVMVPGYKEVEAQRKQEAGET